ncbi:MAG: 5'/3'-nucleotidase SurE [Oligoflexia bacterium]|nr:5'/3'-nucleotidase SurE [Oligoflexia bacterium]
MSDRLFLLTNDDGVDSPGIRILKKVLDTVGRAVIVAPESDRSGCSHALTMMKPLNLVELEKDIYSLSGFPSDCVYLGLYGLLEKKPDLVISGINPGGNMGFDIYYSGTVAGAREALIEGIQGLAVSLTGTPEDGFYYWEDVAVFTREFIISFFNRSYKGNGLININYPNRPRERIKGTRITRMGAKHYSERVIRHKEEKGKEVCWVRGKYKGFSDVEGTDCTAVANEYVSITPVMLDYTDYNAIEELQEWDI